MMQKVKVFILQIRENYSANRSCFIDLIDENKKIILPILVGQCEGQIIAFHFEGNIPIRPFTHDLIQHLADALHFELEQIIIREFKMGIFYSSLYWKKDGETIILDARTSDAIALAQRFEVPMYVTEQVIREAGVNKERIEEELGLFIDEIEEEQSTPKGLAANTLSELEEMLAEALENEDYERAARIRDEIEKRK
jgi:hypothetical protein